jgi:hypothetical protein
VHCDVALGATLAGEQATETDETVAVVGSIWLPPVPLPQAAAANTHKEAMTPDMIRQIEKLLAMPCKRSIWKHQWSTYARSMTG